VTTSVTHVWRLLKWGRTLARHGALTGIEQDPLTPPPVRRLARLARFGARIPPIPEYAKAMEEIGPAAIKLGQALSTRPDLVGERAAENLSKLQDNLPPAPSAAIKAAIEQAFEAPLETLFAEFDEVPIGSASIAQVHRAVTTDGREVAVKVLRPHIEEEFAKAIETYQGILDIDADQVPAIQSLDRLYGAAERWYDLLANHERQVELASNTSETVALKYRIGHLWQLRLGDVARRPRLNRQHALTRFLCLDARDVVRRHESGTELVANVAQVRVHPDQRFLDHT